MGEEKVRRIKPNEHIRRILKLPSQSFMTIEYESGEREVIDKGYL